MKKKDQRTICRKPFRGGKDKPVKGRISRWYPPAVINDHIKDDEREAKYLHAHTRRQRVNL